MDVKISDAFNYLKSKMKTPAPYAKCVQSYQPSHGHHFGVFIVNFKHTSHNVIRFPLLTLNLQRAGEYSQNTS